MSAKQNDTFYETIKETEEERRENFKVRLNEEFYNAIESLKFVQDQMNKLLA